MEIGVSDILSIAAILGSIYTYFRTKKKIDKQQLAINEYTIEKNRKEKQESLRANLRAFRNKDTNSLIIQNIGQNTARNIRVEYNNLNQENGFFIFDYGKFPYPILNPLDEIKIKCQLCAQVKTLPVITLIWDDDNGANQKKEQPIDLN